ncbi:NADH-quinone oxidoreductase subunit J [Gammaproteobacteria bacterium]|nr:NADH-quinone oxidoreductase subunit J [Gammaproteobacteria bacterium]
MTPIHIIFYIFASIAVCASLMVVVASNPVRGALSLVLAFFAMAGVWLLLQAEFLAIILVLVYVGAVMTLFLFVVMMLKVNVTSILQGFVRYWYISALAVLFIITISIMVLGSFNYDSVPDSNNISNVKQLGLSLYTTYVYQFEIAAVMLLTAIIAAISLTHRPPKFRRIQNPSKQISVTKNERLRIIKMDSEKKLKPNSLGS